jgi:NAD(P)-dependent dehydrogenase (short-subunit alcohol dehydrogenase family)
MSWQKGVWFITGASSGLGLAIGNLVLQRGGRLVATARDARSVQDLARVGGDRVLALSVDVANGSQIAEAVTRAEGRFGAIDVLVNNAGYGLLGSIEEASDEEIRRIMEVNFFGQVRLIKASLPKMRERRRGYIVNMSSMAGVRAAGGAGYYAASKYAVEGMSNALRQELQPLGIGVMVVEPGPFRTNYAEKYLNLAKRSIADYEETAGRLRANVAARHGTQPGDPNRAACAIIDALEHEFPPSHLALGALAAQNIRETLEEQLRQLELFRPKAAMADFPET